MTHAEAIEAVGRLLALFPNGTPANAKGYIGGLAQILLAYPRSICIRVADPVNGAARETRFLPTPADLIGWLERETASLRRPVELHDRFAELAEAQRKRASDKAAAAQKKPAYTLKQMQEKHGPSFGLGVLKEGELAAKQRHLLNIQAANERAWARMEGGTVSAGIPITPTLLAALKGASA